MGDAAACPCCVCDAPGGKKCTACKSRHYCSKACQVLDWQRGHKAQCKQLAADFQDRMLDAIMPLKLKKEEPPIVEDVSPADGAKACLSAVRTAKTAEASALNDDVPSWRGTCAICLDFLPVADGAQRLYACCCKSMCKDCHNKCLQHDARCPLCRTPESRSDAEWLRQLQKHVDKGHPLAQYALGESYTGGTLFKKNCKQAAVWFELSAEQGYALAQRQLGLCYEHGYGVKIDHKTAMMWYRRAAEQGYPLAQINLAAMHYHGRGAAQSYHEAVRWLRLAAAQGFADALRNLGVCYEYGHGVPKDYDQALRLYKRAAAKGHVDAATDIDDVEAMIARRPF